MQSGHLQLGGLLRVNYLDSARECVCFVCLFVDVQERVGGRSLARLGLLLGSGACGGWGAHRLDACIGGSEHHQGNHLGLFSCTHTPQNVHIERRTRARKPLSLLARVLSKSGRVTLTCRRLSLRQRKWIRTRFDLSPLLRSAA